MKKVLVVLASAVQIFAVGAACAHGDHKPKHGGIMGRGDDDISAELVIEHGTATLYIEQEAGPPVDTAQAQGILSLAGPGRASQQVKLFRRGVTSSLPLDSNRSQATGLVRLSTCPTALCCPGSFHSGKEKS